MDTTMKISKELRNKLLLIKIKTEKDTLQQVVEMLVNQYNNK